MPITQKKNFTKKEQLFIKIMLARSKSIQFIADELQCGYYRVKIYAGLLFKAPPIPDKITDEKIMEMSQLLNQKMTYRNISHQTGYPVHTIAYHTLKYRRKTK